MLSNFFKQYVKMFPNEGKNCRNKNDLVLNSFVMSQVKPTAFCFNCTIFEI